MKIAIYPGSFDPPTLGHLDIIERSAKIFDSLIVACMVNPRKKTLFSTDERLEMLCEVTKGISNVKVDSSCALLADYAKTHGAAVIVKGLRAMSDFEMEFQMALLNRKMNPLLDTLFLTAGEHFHYLSSGAVKEIGALGGDISDFIPPDILGKVKDALCRV
jgi:pantetheine-phosphate adenylyltransferase